MERFIRLNDNTAEIQVETYCPYIRKQVILTLLCYPIPKGEIVKGKPTSCNHIECQETHQAHCYLHSLQIETKRLR